MFGQETDSFIPVMFSGSLRSVISGGIVTNRESFEKVILASTTLTGLSITIGKQGPL